MNSNTETVATSSRSGTVEFSRRRLFSLIGLIPLGLFVVFHLLNVSSAWSGPEAFDAAIEAGHRSWVSWLGTVFILAFVAYHSWVGIMLMLKATPFSPPPRRLGHWQYILQRISAVGILLFIPAHVIKAKILPALGGTHETFAGMHHAFAEDPMSALTLIVYLLGTLGVAYHLSNGLWTGFTSLGIARGARAQKRVMYFSMGFFVFLLVLAYGTIAVLFRG